MNPLIKKYYLNCTSSLDYLNTTYLGTHDAPPGFSYGPITTERYILTYITKGKGIFNISGKSYHLEVGCSYIIFPEHIFSHTADSENPWSYCWFGVYGSAFQLFLQLLQLTPQNPFIKHTNTNIINQITDDIFKCTCSK